jgi:2-amino-4-hydroxy-6-hydroxymethyldihydropteridine diphosphokinase
MTGRPDAEAYIGLGANIENPLQQVRQALVELDEIEHTRVLAKSSLYRSTPVGYSNQPDFINAVAKVRTQLSPRELLEHWIWTCCFMARTSPGKKVWSCRIRACMNAVLCFCRLSK